MPKLRWIDDDKARNAVSNVVMKILREDKSLSYGDPKSGNILVHGDNLEALKALLPFYAGRVKCVCIDPPFNTGAAFEHYDDNLEHSTWLSLMFQRLELLHRFLSEDGVMFVILDDSESAYCKIMLDEIFGRNNYVNEIINATNKPFGFKATSSGIFKQSNHILFYAKDKKLLQLNEEALFIEKEYDPQYKYVFADMTLPESEWKWEKVADVVARESGYVSPKEAKKHLGENEFGLRVSTFAIENASRVFRTAAVSGGAYLKRRETIAKSKSLKTSIVRHPNDDMDYMFIGGERVLMYKDRLKEIDGMLLPGEVITDLWTDIPVEGLASEGGVEFPKGKKPEKLIQRCIALSTKSGDIVLDSFLGSGTTAAVAHKMNRRWIGVEMGEHAKTHCAARLKMVVDGEQGAISKHVGWQGGGGFKFYELGELLLDENGAISEGIDFDTLAAHIWWRETEKSWDVATRNGTFLGVYDGIAYAMLYNGVLHDRSYAGGNVLTPKTMRIVREDIGAAKYDRMIVYGECTKLSAAKLKEEKIEFRQTPYDIVTRR